MDRPLLKQAVENRAWIPNLLTLIRFLGGIVLIFLPIPGKAFYTVYILCGLTDALDGFLARRLRTASPMMPILRRRLPGWIWYIVAFVLALRLTSYLVAAFKLHKFAAVHTIANKATGAMVFGVGLVLNLSILTLYCLALAAVATWSSTEELVMHIREEPAK